jgi:hypothetical protein
MSLTPEQKQAVSSWVAAGDNLSLVQKKLSEQFKLSMTYMDVRFLVDDLGLELKNAAPKADATDVTKTVAPGGGVPPPRAAPPAEKKGFVEKLKEKVGLGAGTDDEDELPAEDDYPADTAPLPEPAPAGASTLSIEIDRIIRPGAVVSGNVTFSDGVTGKWALDQMGRLMLDTPQKGYQPTPADVQAFQRELQTQLQRQGF